MVITMWPQQVVRPRGVEPRSREPESHVRSITLRTQYQHASNTIPHESSFDK